MLRSLAFATMVALASASAHSQQVSNEVRVEHRPGQEIFAIVHWRNLQMPNQGEHLYTFETEAGPVTLRHVVTPNIGVLDTSDTLELWDAPADVTIEPAIGVIDEDGEMQFRIYRFQGM